MSLIKAENLYKISRSARRTYLWLSWRLDYHKESQSYCTALICYYFNRKPKFASHGTFLGVVNLAVYYSYWASIFSVLRVSTKKFWDFYTIKYLSSNKMTFSAFYIEKVENRQDIASRQWKNLAPVTSRKSPIWRKIAKIGNTAPGRLGLVGRPLICSKRFPKVDRINKKISYSETYCSKILPCFNLEVLENIRFERKYCNKIY